MTYSEALKVNETMHVKPVKISEIFSPGNLKNQVVSQTLKSLDWEVYIGEDKSESKVEIYEQAPEFLYALISNYNGNLVNVFETEDEAEDMLSQGMTCVLYERVEVVF